MKQVRYGVIGCGAIAQRRHIPEAVANPKSQVVAIADPVKGRAKSIAEGIGAAAYTDYRKMLKEQKLDAVVVCTPNKLHAPQTIDAFKAGLHVLVEKPMAATRAEARKMIAAGKKARKYLMVAMNQRLMPVHVKAKQILDAGQIGKVIAFETSFKHPGPDGWSVDGAKSWFFKKVPAVMGVCGDLGVHKADLLRWLLGEEFVQAGGIISTLDKRTESGRLIPLDDNAYVTLKTRSGVVGSMNISWTNYGGENNATTIYGDNGVLKIGQHPDFGIIVEYRNGEREFHQVGELATNTRQVNSGVIDSFTESILNRRKPAIDGEEGYRSLNVILTAIEAAKAGRYKRIGP
ncbi:MAG: Gfo/Idh/MocA family oxidoreductase [Phycisphaeraceae bacterium]